MAVCARGVLALPLVLVNRIEPDLLGLGAPILAGWLAGRPVRGRLKAVLKPSVIVGVVLPIVDLVVIGSSRLLEGKPVELGIYLPPANSPVCHRSVLYSTLEHCDQGYRTMVEAKSGPSYGRRGSHPPQRQFRMDVTVLW